MMQHSFMWQDVRDLLYALPLFFPYLFAPGYAAGFLCNVFSFRAGSLRSRAAISIVLSFTITPITANLLMRFVSPRSCAIALFCLFLFGAIACAAFEAWQKEKPQLRAAVKPRVHLLWIVLPAVTWIALCLASFPDLQLHHRLWSSVMVYDDGLRDAFINAVLRAGVPPPNPLCFFGAAIPSRYYYYWSTVCALPAALTGLPARAVLGASSIWCGFSLVSCISLYVRWFLGVRVRVQRWTLLGTALLVVTGLDLIPTAISWFGQGFVRADMEWWDGTEIPSWIDSVLWVPHHIAALVCCLAALLLLWPACNAQRRGGAPQAEKSERRPMPVYRIALGALALASAAGLSVYLAFSFGLFLAIWTVRLLLRRNPRAAAPFLVSAACALLLSLPLLHDLAQPAAQQTDMRSGRRAHIITTGLRTSGWIKAHVHSHFLRPPLLLLDLGTTYVLEFGFFLIVLVVVGRHLWRRRERITEEQTALCYLLGTALVVVTFLRSEAIRSNDLGMRSALLMQWVALLWAIPLLHRALARWYSTGVLLRAALVLGLCATPYQLLLLRFAEPISQSVHGPLRPIAALPITPDGRTAYGLRSAEAMLAPLLPPGAVVAYNPFNADRLLLLEDTHAQIATANFADCGTAFGGSRSQCAHTNAVLQRVFGAGVPTVPTEDLDEACRAASTNVLLVQPSDPAWQAPDSWVWKRPALESNAALRAIPCGDRPAVARPVTRMR